MTIACVILAAGRGTRFGSDKRQAEGPWKGPLLHHVLGLYRPHFAKLAVVIGPEDGFGAEACALFSAVSRINPDPERGMGSSLAAGAAWLIEEAASAVIIGLADMPWISPATIAAVARAAGPSVPVAPVHEGKPGFPRALPSLLFPALTRLSGDKGASSLFDWREAHLIECCDPGILRDIDVMGDIQQATREED